MKKVALKKQKSSTTSGTTGIGIRTVMVNNRLAGCGVNPSMVVSAFFLGVHIDIDDVSHCTGTFAQHTGVLVSALFGRIGIRSHVGCMFSASKY